VLKYHFNATRHSKTKNWDADLRSGQDLVAQPGWGKGRLEGSFLERCRKQVHKIERQLNILQGLPWHLNCSYSSSLPVYEVDFTRPFGFDRGVIKKGGFTP
jgi:hypothetical protein